MRCNNCGDYIVDGRCVDCGYIPVPAGEYSVMARVELLELAYIVEGQ